MNKLYYKATHDHDKKQFMLIPVEMISYVNRFGRKDCKIRPIHGEGEMMVTDDKLVVIKEVLKNMK